MDAPAGRTIIYLAGPIDGVAAGESQTWREKAADLVDTGVLLFSPAHAYMNAAPINAQSIDWINKSVIDQCDGVLANLTGAGRGLGTIREIEFARLRNKPVAVAGDLDVHYSAWDLVVRPTLEDAVHELLKAIYAQRVQLKNPIMMLLPGMGDMRGPGDDD